ncbi:MAG: cupin domain-containing protein [Hyphomicrobiales bacterium]
MAFNPNQSTIKECISELYEVQKINNIDTTRIITSRDHGMKQLSLETLSVENIPQGFVKTRLPVFFETPTTLYISTGAPGVKVPSHSHDEGDGIRIMISGSIHYGEKELTQGDWMFIPAGVPYEFEVGNQGATMCYCYGCCCA